MFSDFFDKLTGLFHKEKEIQLDPKLASQILSNTYDACKYEQNTIPLEVLTSYSNYRKERFLFQKVILTLVMIAFFLLPILFIAPEFTLEQKEGDTPGNPFVEISLTSLLPMDKMSAFIGDVKIPIYEMADGTYHAVPDRNGSLNVTIELVNRQYTIKTIQVTGVDTTSPTLVSSERKDGTLIIYFADDSGLLNYEEIYASTLSGTAIKPISYDKSNLSVTFEYPKENMNIFVSDMSDNTLQVALTLK